MSGSNARTRLTIDGNIAIIILVRSHQLNAFDAAMHAALVACLNET
jgi:enoyl-CoA hydratase/carnithine racemase